MKDLIIAAYGSFEIFNFLSYNPDELHSENFSETFPVIDKYSLCKKKKKKKSQKKKNAHKVFINHILLIFKLYVYKSSEKRFINSNNFIAKTPKVKRIEEEIPLNNSKKTIASTKKRHLTDNVISIT